MNIVYAILYLGLVFLLIDAGWRGRKFFGRYLSRWVLVVLWGTAVVMVLILGNQFAIRIPNPFELHQAVIIEDDPTSAKKLGPFVVPSTNADPAAAAKQQFDLLEQAKRNQQ